MEDTKNYEVSLIGQYCKNVKPEDMLTSDSFKVICPDSARKIKGVIIIILVIFVALFCMGSLFLTRIRMNKNIEINVDVVESMISADKPMNTSITFETHKRHEIQLDLK